MTASDLKAIPFVPPLTALKNRFANEAELQEAVAATLGRHCTTAVNREHRFDARNRIDFWIPEMRIGIECKVKPNGMAVWRQLDRYADHVDALILVTTAPVDRLLIPRNSSGEQIGFILIELWKNL